MQNMGKRNAELREDEDIMEATRLKQNEEVEEVSAKKKTVEDFSDWVASIKNVSLAAKAKTLWRYLNDSRVPLSDKAVIVAALLYCISPIDLVPDHIPLAGLLDDLAVVLRVLAYITVDGEIEKRQDGRTDCS